MTQNSNNEINHNSNNYDMPAGITISIPPSSSSALAGGAISATNNDQQQRNINNTSRPSKNHGPNGGGRDEENHPCSVVVNFPGENEGPNEGNFQHHESGQQYDDVVLLTDHTNGSDQNLSTATTTTTATTTDSSTSTPPPLLPDHVSIFSTTNRDHHGEENNHLILSNSGHSSSFLSRMRQQQEERTSGLEESSNIPTRIIPSYTERERSSITRHQSPSLVIPDRNNIRESRRHDARVWATSPPSTMISTRKDELSAVAGGTARSTSATNNTPTNLVDATALTTLTPSNFSSSSFGGTTMMPNTMVRKHNQQEFQQRPIRNHQRISIEKLLNTIEIVQSILDDEDDFDEEGQGEMYPSLLWRGGHLRGSGRRNQ